MCLNIKGQKLIISDPPQTWNGGGGVIYGDSKRNGFYGAGNDTLIGRTGDDTYVVWVTTTKIVEEANAGNDTLDSRIWGVTALPTFVENLVLSGPGSTSGLGNALANILVAGKVGATLDGLAGDDVLVAGQGADILRVQAGNGSDLIENFTPGSDTVELRGYGIDGFEAVKRIAHQTGDDLTLNFANGESLVLRDVDLADLDAYDFGFNGPLPALLPGQQGLSGPGNAYTAFGWYVLNNVWNPGPLVYETDYLIDSVFDPLDLTSGVSFTWSFPHKTEAHPTIIAYPEVIFGPAPMGGGDKPSDVGGMFPLRVDAIDELTARYDVSYEGNTGGFNVAFDIWRPPYTPFLRRDRRREQRDAALDLARASLRGALGAVSLPRGRLRRGSGQGGSREPDHSAHVVGEVGEPDLHLGPGEADGSDDHAHGPLLPGEDMLDAGADLGLRGVGARGAPRHRLALRLLAMDPAREAGLRETRLVLRGPIGGIRPDPARRVRAIEQRGQFRAVVTRGMRGGPGPDQPVATIDADMVLVAEHRHRDVHALRTVRRRFGLGVFHRPAGIAVLLTQFRGLFRPVLGNTPLAQRPLLVLGVSLLRRRHHGGIDDLPAHGDETRGPELRVEAAEQRLDRRDAIQCRPRQPFPEIPDRVRVRHPVRERQPKEAHERQPILDQVFRPLIRQRMARLQDQDPKHQHVIVGRPATLRAIRARHGALQFGSEHLEIDQRVHPLEVVALRREIPKPLLDVEKPSLPPHDPSPSRPRAE